MKFYKLNPYKMEHKMEYERMWTFNTSPESEISTASYTII